MLLVHDNASYELWIPANGTLEAGPDPGELDSIWAGSVAGDALLGAARDDAGRDCLVNVSIANPGRERWRICDLDDFPLPSVDGRYLALPRFGGDGPHHEVRIDVRDLKTGDVVVRHKVTVPEPVNWLPVWESDEALLIVVHTPEGQTPYWLRCPVSPEEPCERVPPPDAGPVTAFAFPGGL